MVEKSFKEPQIDKKSFLNAMSRTKAWVMHEDLASILQEEQYKGFIEAKKERLKLFYLNISNSQMVRNQIDNIVEENLEKDIYEISKDSEGNFILQEVTSSSDDRFVRKINLDEIDLIKIAKVVEKSMKEYLRHNTFCNNGILSSEEIPKILRQYINLSRECQEKIN